MKKIWVGIAVLLLLLSAGTALADHHDDFVDACRGKTITQGEEGAQKTSPSHGKEAYAGRDVSFVDLPDGGFIAVWNDVTVLDDADTADGITAHVRDAQTGGSSCVVAGEELRSLAQEAASAGSRKTLVINRGANGEIESLSLGHVHTFEEASGVVSLGQTAEGSGQILNYIAGFQMGSGQSGVQALNGLLTRGSEGNSTPFDLNIPEIAGVGGHIKGEFVTYGSVDSADFNPFDLDIDMTFWVKMHVENLDLKFTTPSINAPAIDMIPIKIPIVPEILELDFSPKLVLGGSITGEVNCGWDFKLGARVWVDSDWDANCDTIADADSWLNSLKIGGSVFGGLSLGGRISVLAGMLGLGVNYKIGVVLTGNAEIAPPPDLKWHACEDMKCIQGDLHPRKGPLSLDLSVLGGLISTSLAKFTDPVDGDPLLRFYDSMTFGDHSLDGSCPHYGYRLDVTVIDITDQPVQGATVSYEPEEEPFKARASAVTDSSGVATLYVPLAYPSQKAASLTEGDSYEITLKAQMGEGAPATTSYTVRGLDKNGKLLNPTARIRLTDIGSAVVMYHYAPTGIDYGGDGYSETIRVPVTTETDLEALKADLTKSRRFVGPDPDGAVSYVLDPNTEQQLTDEGLLSGGQILCHLYYVPGCTFAFDPGGGSGSMAEMDCLYNRDFQVPWCAFHAPSAGSVFAGWSVNGQTLQPPNGSYYARYECGTPRDNGANVVTLQATWRTVDLTQADFTLPKGIGEIGDEAFSGSAMTSVYIPDGCTSIGSGAFRNCPNLKQVRIPNGCTVAEDAFDDRELLILGSLGGPADLFCRQHGKYTFVEE